MNQYLEESKLTAPVEAIDPEPERILEEEEEFESHREIESLGYDLVKMTGSTHKYSYGFYRVKAEHNKESGKWEITKVRKVDQDFVDHFYIPEKILPER